MYSQDIPVYKEWIFLRQTNRLIGIEFYVCPLLQLPFGVVPFSYCIVVVIAVIFALVVGISLCLAILQVTLKTAPESAENAHHITLQLLFHFKA